MKILLIFLFALSINSQFEAVRNNQGVVNANINGIPVVKRPQKQPQQMQQRQVQQAINTLPTKSAQQAEDDSDTTPVKVESRRTSTSTHASATPSTTPSTSSSSSAAAAPTSKKTEKSSPPILTRSKSTLDKKSGGVTYCASLLVLFASIMTSIDFNNTFL